ncbi:uncharacterized protein SCHCODRAFT_02641977 [Schizophyllum commune H4-8]|uniref:uncharacterized protein n=1 Tax=Schizophyllum commune (strain H4-8 / FGSC 9210) TaxID=578458 RepID=UPI00215DDD1E|nr:uncharacterized protein SCHCODRAFT_02641977 [Schizophyllum commune H4-8]KAI5886548.1 hypothetical protein SCHCODRAFT_02641977 [Schizophyllum commune H4-8]
MSCTLGLPVVLCEAGTTDNPRPWQDWQFPSRLAGHGNAFIPRAFGAVFRPESCCSLRRDARMDVGYLAAKWTRRIFEAAGRASRDVSYHC